MKRLFLLILIGGMIMSGELHAEINPKIFKLDNGLEVWVVERKVLPFVVFKFVFPAGSVFDPEDKAGVANLTSELIVEGTKRKTAVELSEYVEFIGAELSSGCNRDFATLSLKILTRYLSKGLDLIGELIKEPRFSEEDFERVKSETIGEIIKEEEDPDAIAIKRFFEEVYRKQHPYHRPVKGYVKTVKNITLDEVKLFYRLHYLPEGSFLIIVGNVDAEEIVKKLNKLLADWVGRAQSYPEIKAPQYNPGKVVVEKDVTQANVVIGHLGVRRSNDDFIKLYVANQILGGGGLTSRLFYRIREKGGFSYSIYSLFEPSLYNGTFRIVFQTKNSSAKKAIDEVIDEVKKYVENGPTEQELEDAKRYITGSFPLRIDTSGEIASYLAFAAFYGLGSDYLNKFSDMVRSVTLDDVKQVVRKYIHPDKFTIVVVTKNSGL